MRRCRSTTRRIPAAEVRRAYPAFVLLPGHGGCVRSGADQLHVRRDGSGCGVSACHTECRHGCRSAATSDRCYKAGGVPGQALATGGGARGHQTIASSRGVTTSTSTSPKNYRKISYRLHNGLDGAGADGRMLKSAKVVSPVHSGHRKCRSPPPGDGHLSVIACAFRHAGSVDESLQRSLDQQRGVA